MTLAAGTRLGPYEVVSAIGAGGMGEVYRARDSRLGREVAIKVLSTAVSADRDRLRRFEQEARAASALNHPNILTVHDVGSEEGAPYVVSELLEGETLRERLAGGRLAPRKAIDYGIQIARGLAAAHGKGIVHRDLKPENVFVTRDGRVKILDFGLAKLRPQETGDADAISRAGTIEGTEPGVLLGTVGYMSPEQVRGKPLDHRSDIFAFGAVLYEMLSGRRAFLGDSPVETMNAILKDDPPELPESGDFPAGLERIVLRCLEKDLEERFQAALDLAFMLETVSGAAPRRGPAAALASAEESSQRSVAVLPFKDLARDPENAHLGIGLADATITELALVKSLLVRPTAAVLRYQDRPVDPREAGRELGVDAVADGSFLRSGSRMRVTVQLIATQGGKHLWGTKIDTSLEDVFRMQDEVSRKIAEALEVELSPADEQRLARSSRSVSPAHELYLKGRYLLFSDTNLADVNRAIELFEQAREADPRFALAIIGLADAYTRMGFSFDPDGDWYARAQTMCDEALALDPDLPEARYLRGRLRWSPRGGFDHAGALREFHAAIAGRPNLVEAHHFTAMLLLHISLLDESFQRFERALALNPEDQYARLHRGLTRYLEGRFEEARVLTEAVVARAASPWAPYQLAMCHMRLDETGAAAQVLERASRRFPGDVLFHSLRGLLAARAGERGRAEEQIALITANRKAFGHYHHAQYDVACMYALLGEKNVALDWLTQSARNGFPCRDFFARDPFLAALHGEPGFERLLEELKRERDGYRSLYEELQRTVSGPSESSASAG